MGYVFALLAILVNLVKWALILRIVFDWVQMLARYWRPRGVALVVASAVYGLTDPPLNVVKGRVPPLNLGGMSLDLGFIIVLIVVSILYTVLQSLTLAFS